MKGIFIYLNWRIYAKTSFSLCLFFSTNVFSQSPSFVTLHLGGGGIEGSRNDQADLQLASELSFNFPVSQHLYLSVGASSTGSIPIFSALLETDTADYDNYFIGVKPFYSVASWLDIHAGAIIGYGKVREYAPVRTQGQTQFYEHQSATGLSYGANVGLTLHVFDHFGFGLGAEYIDLPSGFRSTNFFTQWRFYF